MRRIQTDILVIGGGAIGTGILRDLAMRGFNCVLVERRDLAYGTTGRYHGLLHSGGRYAVKDAHAAKECIVENRILRRIMPQCIEDTGGFFVLTTQDDPGYVPLFLAGCDNAGIPVEELSIHQMLREEPLLNPKIQRCFRLPDASADSFLAADLNAKSAYLYGAQALTYHEVISLSSSSQPGTSNLTVTGALCHDLVKDEDVQVDASIVVNAAGAWAGIVANMVGIRLQMLPGKGSMVAVNHRIVNTVINRCKIPSDGDILVPAHTVAVIGTTDIRVVDPDHYSIDPWEIRLMLDEGEKIIPRFKEFRILRAWAGVRPLIQEENKGTNRAISRAFTLLDHANRDGVDGFVTITSGKWTTYRKMAEATVDKICEKLEVDRRCRTHLETLPTIHEANKSGHYLGARLHTIEQEASYGQLVCECELATKDEVERVIVQYDSKTIDDIRRDVRLGMGPCQGAFCAFRAAGILHELRHNPVIETNVSLRDFLQERWKGNFPILWGQQLRQMRFNELIYIDLFNANNLPGEINSRLSPEGYSRPSLEEIPRSIDNPPRARSQPPLTHSHPEDIVIIGAGLSGLITGWRASIGKRKTHIITKGWGATHWGSGCIDIMGYEPPDYKQRIDSPINYLEKFIGSNPNHPYACVGIDLLEKAVASFLELSKTAGYPFHGSIEKNLQLPTALGTLRPTCLAPITMIAGDACQSSPMLIIGFNRFLDFYPSLIADNLNAQGIFARDILLDIKSLRTRKFLSGMVLARLFDNPEFRQEVIDTLKPKLGSVGRVGFPAVLGLYKTKEAISHLETSLGVPIFEIPGLPPSIPGIRLHNLLVSAIDRKYGSIYNGMTVTRSSVDNNLISSVWSEASARQKSHIAKTYVLATGGILGGGITINYNDYAQETVFDLPVEMLDQSNQWFNSEFLSSKSHPLHTIGLQADASLKPTDSFGQTIYQNLYVVGTLMANCDPIHERSMEGIALATGFKVGENLTKGELQ